MHHNALLFQEKPEENIIELRYLHGCSIYNAVIDYNPQNVLLDK